MIRLPDPARRLLSTLWPSLLITYLWVLPEAVLRAVAGVQTAATPTVLILAVLILAVLILAVLILAVLILAVLILAVLILAVLILAVAVAHDTGTRERVRGQRR